ncbi:MAG: hypothetical protein RR192_01200 [Peptostreptococcaceae bacterium]
MLLKKGNRGVGKVSNKPIEERILDGIMRNLNNINVISSLNNKTPIFNEGFNWCLKEKKRILYIINLDRKDVDILGIISKGLINYIDDKNSRVHSDKINVCTHNRALYIDEKFDLVIYDEINARPRYSRESIINVMNYRCNNYGIMIGYSVELIFGNELTLFNFKKHKQIPIVEPRIITTRMNVEEEIPMGVYEYLEWSINTNRKVIIYVPDNEKVDRIFKYLHHIQDKLTRNIFKKKIGKFDRNDISEFLASDYGILVTDDLNENYTIHPVNIMVFFADSIDFNYKDLIYISSKVNRLSMTEREEVIFLCNCETENMDKCREILRELNKKAWEEGFLKL